MTSEFNNWKGSTQFGPGFLINVYSKTLQVRADSISIKKRWNSNANAQP